MKDLEIWGTWNNAGNTSHPLATKEGEFSLNSSLFFSRFSNWCTLLIFWMFQLIRAWASIWEPIYRLVWKFLRNSDFFSKSRNKYWDQLLAWWPKIIQNFVLKVWFNVVNIFRLQHGSLTSYSKHYMPKQSLI